MGLCITRRIGESLVAKPADPRSLPFRIDVAVIQAAADAPIVVIHTEGGIETKLPKGNQNRFSFVTSSAETIELSITAAGKGKIRVFIKAPTTVLLLRSELEDEWRGGSKAG